MSRGSRNTSRIAMIAITAISSIRVKPAYGAWLGLLRFPPRLAARRCPAGIGANRAWLRTPASAGIGGNRARHLLLLTEDDLHVIDVELHLAAGRALPVDADPELARRAAEVGDGLVHEDREALDEAAHARVARLARALDAHDHGLVELPLEARDVGVGQLLLAAFHHAGLDRVLVLVVVAQDRDLGFH